MFVRVVVATCQTGTFPSHEILPGHELDYPLNQFVPHGKAIKTWTWHYTPHTHLNCLRKFVHIQYCDEFLLEGLHNSELVIRTCLDWGLWGNWIMDLNSRVMCCGLSLLWLVIMIIEWQVVHNTLCIVVTQAETVKQLMSAVSTAHSLWTRGLEWEG